MTSFEAKRVVWVPAEGPVTVGSKVYFTRGMFGRWVGRVRKLRIKRLRGPFQGRKYLVAEVSYSRANGSAGSAVVSFDSLQLAVPEEQ